MHPFNKPRLLTTHLALGALLISSAGCAGAKERKALEEAWNNFGDLAGIGNLDDDDEDGTPDWEQNGVEGDNDLLEVEIPANVAAGVKDGESLLVTLGGDTDNIRVWLDGEVLMGDGGEIEATLTTGESAIILGVEFADLLISGSLTLSHIDKDGVELYGATFDVIASPMILNHHLQYAEEMWMVEMSSWGYSNLDMAEAIEAELGDRFQTIPGTDYGYDVWIQDEVEWSTLNGANGLRTDLVIDSIRNTGGSGLDDFPEDYLVQPDVIASSWGSGWGNTYDSFGNLEISPPVSVDGVDYPYGRVFWGQRGTTGPTEDLRDQLTSQGVQKPFQQDTIWLCVGHIDEVHTFVPDPDAPRGFRLLMGSVTAGYEFLEGLGDNTAIPKYSSDYHYSTVGEILDDTALRTWNESLQTTYLDDIEQVFRDELAITDEEIIYIPSVFEENRWCPNNTALALIPGIVNSLIATGNDETPTKLFLPDPFIRANNASQDEDPLIQYVNDLLPSSSEAYWVDNWDVYHLGMGEVHCGTNAQRTPDGEGTWISNARHLIEE